MDRAPLPPSPVHVPYDRDDSGLGPPGPIEAYPREFSVDQGDQTARTAHQPRARQLSAISPAKMLGRVGMAIGDDPVGKD